MKTTDKEIEKEEWADIEDQEGYYQISSTGIVRSLDRYVNKKAQRISRGKILKPRKNRFGYLIIGFYRNGKGRNKKIHRLVASAFIPNPENKPQINHKDGNKENNLVSNLEWCTASENVRHAYDTGLHLGTWKGLNGEKHHSTKLSDNDCRKIIELNNSGVTKINLAKQFNVCTNTIQTAFKRELKSLLDQEQ